MNTTLTDPPEDALSHAEDPYHDDAPHHGDPGGGHGHGAASGFRSMPHNLDAEKALLGALLVNNRAYEQV
ncbi:MAG TPA: hypothetical protein DC046_02875, partial [Rhodospirillaceae bacterium]|nr:hypothetical protein [Rhodospirillaceae bacterium]